MIDWQYMREDAKLANMIGWQYMRDAKLAIWLAVDKRRCWSDNMIGSIWEKMLNWQYDWLYMREDAKLAIWMAIHEKRYQTGQYDWLYMRKDAKLAIWLACSSWEKMLKWQNDWQHTRLKTMNRHECGHGLNYKEGE